MPVVQLSKFLCGAVVLLAFAGCGAAEEPQGAEEQSLDSPVSARQGELSRLRELQAIKDFDSAGSYEEPAPVQTLIGAGGMPPGGYQSTITCAGDPQCKFIHVPRCTRNEKQCYGGYCVISDVAGCTP